MADHKKTTHGNNDRWDYLGAAGNDNLYCKMCENAIQWLNEEKTDGYQDPDRGDCQAYGEKPNRVMSNNAPCPRFVERTSNVPTFSEHMSIWLKRFFENNPRSAHKK